MVTLRLAERKVALLEEQPGGEPAFEVREIRKLTDSGRQLAMLTTHPGLPLQQHKR